MSLSSLTWVNGALTLLLSNAGQQWDEGTHYAVLVKNAHTPAATNTTYATVSANICDSANYAHVNITNKTVTGAALTAKIDSDDIDFTSGGANVMVARTMFVFEGTAGSPQSADKSVGYMDLNVGGNSDVNVNAAIVLNANGIAVAA